MKKSQMIMPEYFDRSIDLVQEENLFDAFKHSLIVLENLDKEKLISLKGKTYMEGKWTVNEIFQHITDFERILSYRTMLFARGFLQAQMGFDENTIAKCSKAENRDMTDIIDELIAVRTSTIALFKTFDTEDYKKTGTNWKYDISVLAMGFNIIGHQIHHLKIINEKYFCL